MGIDPLDQRIQGLRILSDKGIKQALDLDLLRITPSFDYRIDTGRIQPATIDLKIKKITETELVNGPIMLPDDELVLQAHSKNEILLTEKYEFAPFEVSSMRVIWPSIDARSSLRRLGNYVPNQGNMFFTNHQGSHIELNNYSFNNLKLSAEEKIAQMFVCVDPFKDNLRTWPEEYNKAVEAVKSLDMGMCLDDSQHIEYLLKKGYLEVTPKTKFHKGFLLMHASNKAYKMRKIEGGIDFANRQKYKHEDLLEEIDISNGINIFPGEHIIIETEESLKLSEYVGLRFWDNHMNKTMDIMKKLGENQDDKILLEEFKHLIADERQISILTDGWVDPGYNGSFSRQPKWNTPQFIKPGDVIGMGQIFYFPNGVGNTYGSEILGSQYQNKRWTDFKK